MEWEEALVMAWAGDVTVGGLQRVGERTFAGTRGNGEVAPKPIICAPKL
jgi:hypothetical protein